MKRQSNQSEENTAAKKLAEHVLKRTFRKGKTLRDREGGAKARNESNKAERAAWQNDSKATANTFPYHTCNGHRNHNTWTGKGGQRIVLTPRVK